MNLRKEAEDREDESRPTRDVIVCAVRIKNRQPVRVWLSVGQVVGILALRGHISVAQGRQRFRHAYLLEVSGRIQADPSQACVELIPVEI